MTEFDSAQEILKRLIELRQELEFAAETFEKGASDGGRSSVQITLDVLDSFLATVFDADGAKPLVPLRQLRYALYDLDRGKVVPLLAPQKRDHRPRDSVAKEAFMAWAAGCMELFVEGGIPRKTAARRVADPLHAMGYRNGSNKRITPQNVENWRDRMRSESPSETPAVGRFRRIAEKFRSTDQETAAAFILQRLPLVVPPELPKKPPA